MISILPSIPLSLIRKIFLSISFLFLFTYIQAQERCGTVQYSKMLSAKFLRENSERFENWLSKKIKSRNQTLEQQRTQTTTYQVPVVVHIIHKGEAVGIGTNISDAQILSQIQVLNDDFKRLNTDAFNTPAEFLPFAGSMDIEFVLAKQDPQGQPCTGIVRAKGAKNSWTYNDDTNLKATSYWPAEDYFNIWVCNLTDYLGYTQFPVSNLAGLENSPDNRLTDGVVIGYTYFGTKNGGAFNLSNRYDLGRTVTHEVGHFFGLRHIWGDDNGLCITNGGKDDYVDDTPDQGDNTSSCPSGTRISCSVHNMYQNYLDYTDDACMNMFTAGQVSRMITVLENSPRRVSLLTSHGLNDPTPNADDLALVKIKSPVSNVCASLIAPSIMITNDGTNTITSARIQLKINSIITETKDFVLNLGITDSTIVNFTSQILSEGNSTIEFEILFTNGNTDGDSFNNKISINTQFYNSIATPFSEEFVLMPAKWIIQNPDKLNTWQTRSVPNGHLGNTAVFLDYYNDTNINTEDALITAPLDLTNQTEAFLTFDVSYATRFQTNYDTLKAFVLTNCNADYTKGDQIYNKAGTALATALPTNLFYSPKDENDWRTEIVDLKPYAGQDNIRIAFVGTNMNGNTIYLDNVSIVNTTNLDLAIIKIESPSILSCSNPSSKIIVQNKGTSTINSFSIQSKINGGNPTVKSFTGLQILLGETFETELNSISLIDGVNSLDFEIISVNNGAGETDITNNSKSISVNSKNTSKIIPLRENFNSGIDQSWISFNPSDGMVWSSVAVDATHVKAVYFNAYDNENSGDEAWLVTPLLDFSNTTQASVFFERSYSYNSDTSEELRVLASTGCGDAFDLVLYDKVEFALANSTASTRWKPIKESDWTKEFIDLTFLAGQKDIRLAFVATNGYGNNLYLDNVEFFTSNDPTPIAPTKPITLHPSKNTYADFAITFNFPDQQTASIDVIDLMGRSIFTQKLEYSLNQTYSVALDNACTGIYIVRVYSNTGTFAQRIFISK